MPHRERGTWRDEARKPEPHDPITQFGEMPLCSVENVVISNFSRKIEIDPSIANLRDEVSVNRNIFTSRSVARDFGGDRYSVQIFAFNAFKRFRKLGLGELASNFYGRKFGAGGTDVFDSGHHDPSIFLEVIWPHVEIGKIYKGALRQLAGSEGFFKSEIGFFEGTPLQNANYDQKKSKKR